MARYSLRSFVCLLILAYALLAMWTNRAPWHQRQEIGKTHTELSVAEFSPNGDLVAVGDVSGELRLWRTIPLTQIAVLECGGGPLSAVSFSQDGSVVLAGGLDGTVRAWSLSTAQPRCILQASHARGVASVGVSRDGRHGVSVGFDRKAVVWDLQEGREIAVIGPDVSGAALSPDGKHVLTRHGDWVARIFPIDGGKCVTELAGHRGPLLRASYMARGEKILTTSADGTARVWRSATGEQLAVLKHQGDHNVDIAATSRRGDLLLTGGRLGDSVCLWNLLSLELERRYVTRLGGVTSMRFLGDETFVVLNIDGLARVYGCGSGEMLGAFDFRAPRVIVSSGRGDAIALDGKTACLWRYRGPRGRPWQRLEVWLGVLSAAVLLWSLWRDRRHFKSLAAKQAAEEAH